MRPKDSATVDAQGRLVLPASVARTRGLAPGREIAMEDELDSVLLRRSVEHLAKVYVEPTSRCNLNCRTCIRNSWEEPPGDMSELTFARLLEGLTQFDPPPSVLFGGFGEPLTHPHIAEMVKRAKAAGVSQVELITNGCLLTQDMSQRLIEAGLDILWVSLDGIRPESYSDVRLGAMLPQVLDNLRGFREVRRRLCDLSTLPGAEELPGAGVLHRMMGDHAGAERSLVQGAQTLAGPDPLAGCPGWDTPGASDAPDRPDRLLPAPELGITFVAMKRNVADLPYLLWVGRLLGARRFNVSNVIPYTQDLDAQILYPDALRIAPLPTTGNPELSLPPMDVTDLTRRPLHSALHGRHEPMLVGADRSGVSRRCPFVEAGSVSVAWDGGVSPCQGLVHTHEEYVYGRKRLVERYRVGSLNEQSLADIWRDQDYLAFRRRVQDFDFAPCLACGICVMAQGNQEDCEDDVFPRCGACLWSHGLIRCP